MDSDHPSVADAYASWSNADPFSWSRVQAPFPLTSTPQVKLADPSEFRPVSVPEPIKPRGMVGIIGAGMSGLYAGLLLKRNNIPFHIFEARKDRIGGRIYTCRDEFGPGKHQYFEAGAMRLPKIPSQKPVFDLIKYLNQQLKGQADSQIELVNYHYKCEDGNLVYVNGKVQQDGKRMTLKYANEHPEELGYIDLHPEDAWKTADSLMDEVMKPLLKEFQEYARKDKSGEFFAKYDHMSLRYYLSNCVNPKWYPAKINYVETMTSGTNAFSYGLVESVIEYDDFNSQKADEWKTIKNGMSRLPEACAALLGKENITMGAIVYKINVKRDGHVAVTYSTDGLVPSKSPKETNFDMLLIAVPNPVLRMIQRPLWSPSKEEAIRACNVQACYKLGLQFHTRFWEQCDRPAYGGQSTTDTPSRWIVYPSYGLNDRGKGILLTYCWSTDALGILPAKDEQRKECALRDLEVLYPDVNIREQFTGKYKSVHWSAEWSTGVTDFLPGQFSHLLPNLRKHEGNIFFAGEHISVRHGWIAGALDSAGYACKQMFPDIHFEVLKPNNEQ